jgi:hypothetical protein
MKMRTIAVVASVALLVNFLMVSRATAGSLTSQTRSVTALIVNAGGQLQDQRSDTTTNSINLETSEATNTFGVNESSHPRLDSGFSSNPLAYNINGLTIFSTCTTSATANNANQHTFGEASVDLFINISDAARQYGWTYHGPLIMSQTGVGTAGVVFSWTGDHNYQFFRTFDNNANISDLNFSDQFPLGTGNYHFHLDVDTQVSLDSTPNGAGTGNLNMTGGTLTLDIPEPATAMLTAAAAGFLALRWRRGALARRFTRAAQR